MREGLLPSKSQEVVIVFLDADGFTTNLHGIHSLLTMKGVDPSHVRFFLVQSSENYQEMEVALLVSEMDAMKRGTVIKDSPVQMFLVRALQDSLNKLDSQRASNNNRQLLNRTGRDSIVINAQTGAVNKGLTGFLHPDSATKSTDVKPV